jgi:PGAP1-like protein
VVRTMGRRGASVIVMCLLMANALYSQQSRILLWQPASNTDRRRVYHPEPILFVHGINAKDDGWADLAIPTLKDYFSGYDLPPDAAAFVGVQANLNARQENYLHTFNYGDKPGQSTLNSNGFEHIEWNASADHRDYHDFTNVFTGALQPAPHDARLTLDERINGSIDGSVVGIRQAYQADPNDPNTRPDIVLVAHSMGGLLSHFYLLWSAPNHHVRRHITIATPHQGSHVANWLMHYNAANRATRIFHGTGLNFLASNLRLFAPHVSSTAGFFKYGALGAVEDLQVIERSGQANLRGYNDLMDFFWNHPAPKLEYVFNVYSRPPGTFGTHYEALRITTAEQSMSAEQLYGDGLVPQWSAAGKDAANDPSIYNGSTNVNPNVHEIDPVVFGVWTNLDHSDAIRHPESLIRSLDGVPYRWPGANSNQWPAYARFYGENQSFSKYFDAPMSNSVAYSDEPGIADLKLLYNRSGGNPLLIASLSTSTVTNGVWQKTTTNRADFAGHQLAIGTGGTVSFLGTVGLKNQGSDAIGWDGSNYWVVAGNEYLPTSLGLGFAWDYQPVATNITAAAAGNFALSTGMISQCLVELARTIFRCSSAVCLQTVSQSLTPTSTFLPCKPRTLLAFLLRKPNMPLMRQ